MCSMSGTGPGGTVQCTVDGMCSVQWAFTGYVVYGTEPGGPVQCIMYSTEAGGAVQCTV